ncbi:hypothetical protein H6P81_016958 [Aristolochia fimbriata]|uniref:Uncharacterized protein n=1 Tax=Aristolochia fimbriata TaxID=158543 RepID=A0AAV7DXV6_ARIFI|nr:hypothetical protein H6P81_016958 [Aristolochia fimbriata]
MLGYSPTKGTIPDFMSLRSFSSKSSTTSKRQLRRPSSSTLFSLSSSFSKEEIGCQSSEAEATSLLTWAPTTSSKSTERSSEKIEKQRNLDNDIPTAIKEQVDQRHYSRHLSFFAPSSTARTIRGSWEDLTDRRRPLPAATLAVLTPKTGKKVRLLINFFVNPIDVFKTSPLFICFLFGCYFLFTFVMSMAVHRLIKEGAINISLFAIPICFRPGF